MFVVKQLIILDQSYTHSSSSPNNTQRLSTETTMERLELAKDG